MFLLYLAIESECTQLDTELWKRPSFYIKKWLYKSIIATFYSTQKQTSKEANFKATNALTHSLKHNTYFCWLTKTTFNPFFNQFSTSLLVACDVILFYNFQQLRWFVFLVLFIFILLLSLSNLHYLKLVENRIFLVFYYFIYFVR